MSQARTEDRPGYLVKRTQQLLRQACDGELRSTGLSMSQYAVLRALADQPGASSAELARRCFVTRQSLQDVLTGLRAAELVAVAEQPTSGRARPLTLTTTGRARLRTAERVVAEVEQRMVAGLTDRDLRHLTTLLAACADNLA
jgi:DNA-binding MarR family transcriptional regulator